MQSARRMEQGRRRSKKIQVKEASQGNIGTCIHTHTHTHYFSLSPPRLAFSRFFSLFLAYLDLGVALAGAVGLVELGGGGAVDGLLGAADLAVVAGPEAVLGAGARARLPVQDAAVLALPHARPVAVVVDLHLGVAARAALERVVPQGGGLDPGENTFH